VALLRKPVSYAFSPPCIYFEWQADVWDCLYLIANCLRANKSQCCRGLLKFLKIYFTMITHSKLCGELTFWKFLIPTRSRRGHNAVGVVWFYKSRHSNFWKIALQWLSIVNCVARRLLRNFYQLPAIEEVAMLWSTVTGWRRLIGCLKLQVIFRTRATNSTALLRKMTYDNKASYDSTPPCKVFEDLQEIYRVALIPSFSCLQTLLYNEYTW